MAPQFCALARAAELLSERWTLLIVRELLLGPRRFRDLTDGLGGVSTSVLAGRLAALARGGLIRRATLGPPAGVAVYELTDHGAALRPARPGTTAEKRREWTRRSHDGQE